MVNGYKTTLGRRAARGSEALDSRVRLVPKPEYQHRKLRVALVSGDAAALFIAWALALGVGTTHFTVSIVIAIMVSHYALRSHGLYLSRVCMNRRQEISALTRAMVTTSLALLVLGRWLTDFSDRNVALGIVASIVTIAMGRGVYNFVLTNARRDGKYARAILVIGTNEDAASTCERLQDHPEYGFRVVGVVGPRAEYQRNKIGVPWLGETNEIESVTKREVLSGAIISASALTPDEITHALRHLQRDGIHIQMSFGLQWTGQKRLRTQLLAHTAMVYIEPGTSRAWQRVCKTVFDRTIAALVLLLTFPALVISAIIIKRHDGGPVLFRQMRVGLNGEAFQMIKLRTMVVDAEARLEELTLLNTRTGSLFKMNKDPRITPFGKLLRVTSIDELPQIINVLKGEMSLVGPRPSLPTEAAGFDTELKRRTSVRPGITGLWQVVARDNPSFTAYRHLDLFYVDNWSLRFDLKIILKTITSVLGRAARALRPWDPSITSAD